MRRVAPALFLLAPFVGGFLLGNLAIRELHLGIILAPFDGGPAAAGRRSSCSPRRARGWRKGRSTSCPGTTRTAGADLLHGDSFVPALGMSAELTQAILALHTIWSICVPIAIVQTFVTDRRTTPLVADVLRRDRAEGDQRSVQVPAIVTTRNGRELSELMPS